MTWTKTSSRRLSVSLLCLILSFSASHSQWLEGDLKDASNRADYLIITPPSFVSAVEPLAAFRASHNSFSVAIVLTDSIYSQFPSVTPDSSLRAFLAQAHASWRKPAPEYVLLAGNPPMVPTHTEASYFKDFGEDSVAIDQWFVDTLSTYSYVSSPTAAVGRYPAWHADELSAMIAKTIQYETASPFEHADRFITVADSGDQEVFEGDAMGLQSIVSAVWKDTVTIFVRPSSVQYKARGEFFNLWNQGTAAVDFYGGANNVQFSRSKYFSTGDTDSLQEGSSVTICFFQSGQRFQETDTVAMAVDLMRARDRGAAAVLTPSGLSYASENYAFASEWRRLVVAQPEMSLGMAVKLTRQLSHGSSVLRRQTLLGDPALAIRHKNVASVTPRLVRPSEFHLFQNYPNPFNPSTTIAYALPQRSRVTLALFNLVGQCVATLVDGEQEAGYHEVRFSTNAGSAAGLASGVYFYRLQAGGFQQTKTLCLVK